MLSCKTPCPVAPSPKKATPTESFSVPLYFELSAAPTARGMLAPTIAFAPNIPLEKSAICIDPPFPLHCPVDLPNISAIIFFVSKPFAMQ